MLKKMFFLFFIVSVFKCQASDFLIGVNSHLYQKKDEEIISTIEKVKSLGIKAIRVDAPWKLVEREKGAYSIPPAWDVIVDYASKNNIDVLFILDYGNKYYDNGDKPISKDAVKGFVNYVDYLTKHFSNRVRFYQIWNEWNNKNGDTTPGKVEDYKALVKNAYPIIKKNAQDSIVITSSFSPAAFNKAIGLERRGDYFRDFLTTDMVNFTDALSIHPYTTYRKPPFHQFKYYTKQIEYAMDLLKSGPFKNKPIYITEIGWTTASSPVAVSLNTQAQDLKNAICQAKKLGYAGVFIYELKDNHLYPKDPEDGFGILDSKMQNKDAANIIQNLACN